jgi:hypothetical protein
MPVLHKSPHVTTELVNGRIVTFVGTVTGLAVVRFNNITKRHIGFRAYDNPFAGNQI